MAGELRRRIEALIALTHAAEEVAELRDDVEQIAPPTRYSGTAGSKVDATLGGGES